MNSSAPAAARWRLSCAAITETERRRKKQDAYNKAHGIVPQTIRKSVRKVLEISHSAEEEKTTAHRKLTDAEREAYIRQAKACLPQRGAYYSERMGLYPAQVRITGARTRFGSCSSQGHICFSWRRDQIIELRGQK